MIKVQEKFESENIPYTKKLCAMPWFSVRQEILFFRRFGLLYGKLCTNFFLRPLMNHPPPAHVNFPDGEPNLRRTEFPVIPAVVSVLKTKFKVHWKQNNLDNNNIWTLSKWPNVKVEVYNWRESIRCFLFDYCSKIIVACKGGNPKTLTWCSKTSLVHQQNKNSCCNLPWTACLPHRL